MLYGGSFDPVHNGHLHIAREASDILDVDKVIFIPAGKPPHKPGQLMASAADRYEMVRLAVEFEPLFAVSDFEIGFDSPSFTLHTVRYFRSQFQSCELFWLIGADSFAQLDKWYKIELLVDICTLVTVGRPGSSFEVDHLLGKLTESQIDKLQKYIIDIPLSGESSTEIRRRLAAGESITGMTPPAVEDYISTLGLYK